MTRRVKISDLQDYLQVLHPSKLLSHPDVENSPKIQEALAGLAQGVAAGLSESLDRANLLSQRWILRSLTMLMSSKNAGFHPSQDDTTTTTHVQQQQQQQQPVRHSRSTHAHPTVATLAAACLHNYVLQPGQKGTDASIAISLEYHSLLTLMTLAIPTLPSSTASSSSSSSSSSSLPTTTTATTNTILPDYSRTPEAEVASAAIIALALTAPYMDLTGMRYAQAVTATLLQVDAAAGGTGKVSAATTTTSTTTGGAPVGSSIPMRNLPSIQAPAAFALAKASQVNYQETIGKQYPRVFREYLKSPFATHKGVLYACMGIVGLVAYMGNHAVLEESVDEGLIQALLGIMRELPRWLWTEKTGGNLAPWRIFEAPPPGSAEETAAKRVLKLFDPTVDLAATYGGGETYYDSLDNVEIIRQRELQLRKEFGEIVDASFSSVGSIEANLDENDDEDAAELGNEGTTTTTTTTTAAAAATGSMENGEKSSKPEGAVMMVENTGSGNDDAMEADVNLVVGQESHRMETKGSLASTATTTITATATARANVSLPSSSSSSTTTAVAAHSSSSLLTSPPTPGLGSGSHWSCFTLEQLRQDRGACSAAVQRRDAALAALTALSIVRTTSRSQQQQLASLSLAPVLTTTITTTTTTTATPVTPPSLIPSNRLRRRILSTPDLLRRLVTMLDSPVGLKTTKLYALTALRWLVDDSFVARLFERGLQAAKAAIAKKSSGSSAATVNASAATSSKRTPIGSEGLAVTLLSALEAIVKPDGSNNEPTKAAAAGGAGGGEDGTGTPSTSSASASSSSIAILVNALAKDLIIIVSPYVLRENPSLMSSKQMAPVGGSPLPLSAIAASSSVLARAAAAALVASTLLPQGVAAVISPSLVAWRNAAVPTAAAYATWRPAPLQGGGGGGAGGGMGIAAATAGLVALDGGSSRTGGLSADGRDPSSSFYLAGMPRMGGNVAAALLFPTKLLKDDATSSAIQKPRKKYKVKEKKEGKESKTPKTPTTEKKSAVAVVATATATQVRSVGKTATPPQAAVTTTTTPPPPPPPPPNYRESKSFVQVYARGVEGDYL